MVAVLPSLGKHIKVERLYLILEVFVVEKEAGDIAQILCVDFLLFGVEFKHANLLLAVNFVARGTPDGAALRVPLELLLASKKVQAEGTNVKNFAVILWRQRREVPRLDHCLSDADELHSLNLSSLEELPDLVFAHAMVLVIFEELFASLFLFLCFLLRLYLRYA